MLADHARREPVRMKGASPAFFFPLSAAPVLVVPPVRWSLRGHRHSDQRHCSLALAPAPASEVPFQRVQLHFDGSDSDSRLLFVGMHPLARPASHLRLAVAYLVTSIGASMSSAAIVRPWGSVYDLNEGSSRHHALRDSSSFSSIVSAKLEN